MAVRFDVRSHRFFEIDDPPRERTAERVPLTPQEIAQFKARYIRGEPDNGTRGYTLPGSILVGPKAPPRK
jgi:hypothetical protein